MRKKERQIEKEIEAIGHGWVDLEAVAATMRSREVEKMSYRVAVTRTR